MKEQIEKQIKEVLKNLGINEEINFSVEHPESFVNGDYSTNVAMVCAKKIGKNPRELAENIKLELEKNILKEISKVEVAGAGFINFYLSREFFTESVKQILEKKENWGKNEILNGKKVMVEYTQPNPFKPFHIGHLMSNAIGESISRVVEFSGAKTIRANYQGDVGPHVAKAIYGLKKFGMPDSSLIVSAQAQYIGECYSKGSNLYDTDENAKKEIDEINKKIYDKSDEEINKIYDWGRKVTLDAFEEIYKLLGTKFDYYFFESEMAVIGEKIVKENVPKIFEESDGAIIFHGEKYDPKLHTRVFVNSKGLPTYETKEIGLTLTKFEKENPDISIVTTAIEQAEYMKVVQKAISLMHPDLESRMKHITHGMMRLATGKMSSRKGNVITGESLLRDSMDVVLEKITERDFSDIEKREISEIVGVAALKYSILKSSLGSDIVYDFEKSISFEGDSGPYLQYTAVRANSILEKSKVFNQKNGNDIPVEITNLEKILYQFSEVIELSYQKLEPHHIATYLTLLASAFNTFYANTKILSDENKYMVYHLELVNAFYQTMKNGLYLLGIETPKRM
ncbi:MAG: arginine--tRNA ligase [bacterium]